MRTVHVNCISIIVLLSVAINQGHSNALAQEKVAQYTVPVYVKFNVSKQLWYV
jgi:hypothetical protein